MIVDIRELENIKFQFTELGVALADLSDKNTQTFEEFEKSLTSVDEKIGSFVNPEELKNLRGAAEAVSKHAQDAAAIFEKISISLGVPLSSLGGSIRGVSDTFDRINRELSAFNLPLKQAGKKVKAKKRDEKDKNKSRFIEMERKTLIGRVRMAAGVLKIPLPGAIAGGLIGIAAWGFKERSRIEKEVGEALNVVEYAFDSGVKGLTKKAADYLGHLGDYMNKFYGISKENTQAVAKGFVDGGIKVESMMAKVNETMGFVGDNYITFALGLDKMFSLSSGESARKTVELMSDYGKSLEGARKSWLAMLMAGKESGIGTNRFVQNVTSAAESLKQFGFDIDNVMEMSRSLQALYQDMGVPRQMAGQQAFLGIQQLAQGIANMSDNWKMLVGERMGFGKGVEAKQKFEDAIYRITSRGEGEEADKELQRVIMAMVDIASQEGERSETITREILATSMGLGVKGARAAVDLKKALDSGDIKKVSEIIEKNKDILINAFETEKQQRNKWQLMMNQWLQGLSKIGQGIVGMLGQSLANLIIYFKSLVPLFSSYLPFGGGAEERERIGKIIQDFTSQSMGYQEKFKSGFSDLIDASKAAGMEVFGESLKALKTAVFVNPFIKEPETPVVSPAGSSRAGLPLPLGGAPQPIPLFTGLWSGVSPGSQLPVSAPKPIPEAVADKPKMSLPASVPTEPLVRTIIIPSGEPGVYPVEPVKRGGEPQFVGGAPSGAGTIPERPRFSAGAMMPSPVGGYPQSNLVDWVGGGISIVNRSVGGVTAGGDIVLEAVGNCPRCGLIFGEDSSQLPDYNRVDMPSFSEEDVDAMARMLTTEVTPKRVRQGLTGTTKTEAVSIAFTAINRLRTGKYGSTYKEVVTGGKGFGTQGARPYGTRYEAMPEARELVREVMSGRYADPTGGATYFYHSTFGQGYGSKRHPELRTVHPRFIEGKMNVLNINNASFWAERQLARQRASDAYEWQRKEEARFERKHRQSPPIRPSEMEDWELETGMTLAE